MSVNTYSFYHASATFTPSAGSGNPIDLGYGALIAEEGIEVAMREDKNTMVVGADGSVMNSLHMGNSAEVTVHLLKTSSANSNLLGVYNAQMANPWSWGQNQIIITHNTTNKNSDSITLHQVTFKRIPNIKFAKEGDIVQWVFDCGSSSHTLGLYNSPATS